MVIIKPLKAGHAATRLGQITTFTFETAGYDTSRVIVVVGYAPTDGRCVIDVPTATLLQLFASGRIGTG